MENHSDRRITELHYYGYGTRIQLLQNEMIAILQGLIAQVCFSGPNTNCISEIRIQNGGAVMYKNYDH